DDLMTDVVTFGDGTNTVEQWNLDIFKNCQLWNQIKTLKDESDVLITYSGQVIVCVLGNVFATESIDSFGSDIEAAKQIEKR
ncbi:MAG: hypothetical protein NZ802_06810, partial [Candidatus Poseidoniales archaeon]|nr:hypothetical protein [Candidatus Poseidoniales archaeon]